MFSITGTTPLLKITKVENYELGDIFAEPLQFPAPLVKGWNRSWQRTL